MPIIFGWRGVTYTAASGFFFCPHCGRRVAYKHRRIRRFFTLFFIPIIPLNLLAEFIECQECRQTFKLEVLAPNLQQQLETQSHREADVKARFAAATIEAMSLLACSRQPVSDACVGAMCAISAKVAGQSLQPAQARALLDSFDRDESRVYRVLQELAGDLNDRGKQLIAQAAYSVASAAGQPTDQQKAIITKIAMVLASGQMNNILQAVLPPNELASIPLHGQSVPPSLPTASVTGQPPAAQVAAPGSPGQAN